MLPSGLPPPEKIEVTFHKATNWTVSAFKKDADGEYVAASSPYKAAALDSHEMDRASGICTVYSHRFDATSNTTIHRIHCKKHLWSVEGPDEEAVRRQAVHYFMQYWADGEYGDLIKQAIDKEKLA